ncbi:MAG: hypothetical protein H8D97_01220 [Proteobacteria bacterium]|nr:hypothetical protein [Pseudomonadota bacterium]
MAKIRTGFVSNSNSSNYVCDICGNSDEGSYDISLRELKMYQCVGGHYICESHTEPLERADYIEFIKKCDHWDVNDIISMEDEEIIELCENDYSIRYNFPKTNCPICNLKHINDDTILTYLQQVLKIDINTVRKQIRTKYSNLDEFKEGIQNK